LSEALRNFAAFLALAAAGAAACAADAPPPPAPPAAPQAVAEGPAWLGVFLGDAPDGGVKIVAVADGGPAAKAGIREGDLVLTANRKPVTDRGKFREVIAGLRPGEKVALEVLREGKLESHVIEAEPRVIKLRIPVEAEGWTGTPPGPEFEPLVLGARGRAGVRSGATLVAIPSELRRLYGAPDGTGALVTRIAEKSPAAASGLKVGDVVVQAGEAPIRDPGDLDQLLALCKIGVPVELGVVRGGKTEKLAIVRTVEAERRARRESRAAELEAEIALLQSRIEGLRRELERLRESTP